MAAEKDLTRDTVCSVEVTPGEVDAGAELTLRGRVSGSPAGDLRGQTLLIEDHNGVSVRRIELTEFDGETNATDALVVKAPINPGAYTWSCVFPADARADGSRPESRAPFSFAVKSHDTSVLVWGAPSAIGPGEAFSIKLGVKCSSACPPDGWTVVIRDHDGKERTAATLSDEPWADTTALYYAEVTLRAPDDEGFYRWEAEAVAAGLDIPHTQPVAGFGVRVAPKRECLVTIFAIDQESQTAVAGANVVVHPYRALTDERGFAELKVPKGQYRLFVSGKRYFPFRVEGEIEADTTIRAELTLDSGLSDADLWS